MLDNNVKSGNAQNDFQSLGRLMVRLMERSTNLADPYALRLQHPENWEDPIRDFLEKTDGGTPEILQKVREISYTGSFLLKVLARFSSDVPRQPLSKAFSLDN